MLIDKIRFGVILSLVRGILLIVLTLAIGIFLFYKGMGTFTTYGHSLSEFLFSSQWAPNDDVNGGGKIGVCYLYFRFYKHLCFSFC